MIGILLQAESNDVKIIMATLAVFIIGAGVIKIWLRRQLKSRGVKVQATIIALEATYGENSKNLWHPVFQYKTLTDETVTHRSALGYNPCPYSEGECVDIIYDSTEKNNFTIDSFMGDFWGYLILIGGLIFLIALLQ